MDKYIYDKITGLGISCKGIAEKLKADRQIEGVGRMKALRKAIIETANAELIII